MQETVEYYPHTLLRTHPRNMRRIYPRQELEEMARSIKERVARGQEGIIEPLIGCWDEGVVVIYVGNKRLRGTRLLGDEAPLVPVIIRQKAEAEQLLDMVTENSIRSRPDPVSEGLHFQTLMQVENIGVTELSRRTGVSTATINARVTLATALGPEIQQLVVNRKLPKGQESIEALLSIEDEEVRLETAKQLASRGATVAVIRRTCRRVAGAIEAGTAPKAGQPGGRLRLEPVVRRLLKEGKLPATGPVVEALASISDAGTRIELAQRLAARQASAEEVVAACELAGMRDGRDEGVRGLDIAVAIEQATAVERGMRVVWDVLGTAILQCCKGCQDPAWGQIVETLKTTCDICGVADLPDVCRTCALVEFMHRLSRRVEREAEKQGRAVRLVLSDVVEVSEPCRQ